MVPAVTCNTMQPWSFRQTCPGERSTAIGPLRRRIRRLIAYVLAEDGDTACVGVLVDAKGQPCFGLAKPPILVDRCAADLTQQRGQCHVQWSVRNGECQTHTKDPMQEASAASWLSGQDAPAEVLSNLTRRACAVPTPCLEQHAARGTRRGSCKVGMQMCVRGSGSCGGMTCACPSSCRSATLARPCQAQRCAPVCARACGTLRSICCEATTHTVVAVRCGVRAQDEARDCGGVRAKRTRRATTRSSKHVVISISISSTSTSTSTSTQEQSKSKSKKSKSGTERTSRRFL